MRGNHDAGGLLRVAGGLFANALSAQLLADDGVVHQLAQNSEGGFPGEGLRLRDGIANAETDPKMFRNDDLHLLCVTKLRDKFFISFPLFVIPSEHASPARTEESLTFIRENNERCLDCARHDKNSHFLPAFTICSNTRRYS